MYHTGETVMYAGTGVCKITDIVKQNFTNTEERTYYVLKAVYDSSGTTIYCPVDNAEIKIRDLLSRKQIEEMLCGNCCDDENPKQPLWTDNASARKRLFTQIVKDGNQPEIFQLITEIHEKQQEMQQNGKKLHISDEKIMHEAEKIISQELAYTMNINIDEVADFVTQKMQAAAD